MTAALDFDPKDPVALTAALVRCPSVTPEEGGALALLERVLAPHGFVCTRVDRGGVSNLYARLGAAGPVLGFAGHTDVVPVGDSGAWTRDPFGAEIAEGRLWGRGAVDMKSGVAAFVAAVLRRLESDGPPSGSLALVITGDEEGDAIDGTRALLDWMEAQGERLDGCIVGEPTSKASLGDQIKIGRRGSLNTQVVAIGRQGHAAYPEVALNPLPPLMRLLDGLASATLDEGTEHFQPSTLALTSVDTGNPASNVIPASARGAFNIRFNDSHTAETLEAWIRAQAATISEATEVQFEITFKRSGPSFLTPPGALSEAASIAVEQEIGTRPAFSTGGGTSDARFIKDHCPVIELGLVGDTMHQVDENAPVADIERLCKVYGRVIEQFFKEASVA